MNRTIAFLLLLSALALTSCAEDTLGPGSSNTLEATINGSTVTFNVTTAAGGEPTYDTSTHQVTFNGTVISTTTKSVTVFVTLNLDAASYPATVTDPDLNIVYIEKSGTQTDAYGLSGTANQVVVSSRNGDVISGTFSASLVHQTDPTKKLTISNGKFTVNLTRI